MENGSPWNKNSSKLKDDKSWSLHVHLPKFVIFQILCEVNLLLWFMNLKWDMCGDFNFPIILELHLSFKNTWKNVNKIWQPYPLTQKLPRVVVPMHQSSNHTSRLSIVVNCPWIPRSVRTVWSLVSEEGGSGDRPIWRQPRSQGASLHPYRKYRVHVFELNLSTVLSRGGRNCLFKMALTFLKGKWRRKINHYLN